MTPSRIVCAVDFSANGRAVLAQALALSYWHDSALDVLYVRPGRPPRQPGADEGLHAHLAEFVAQADRGRTRPSTFVLAGEPVSAMLEHVRQRPVSLVVVGQDGPRRTLYWSRGRFAAAVARRIERPVMTVTGRAPLLAADAQFRRIVCATDLSLAAAGALREALLLAQQSGGHLTVLHVVDRFPRETVYAASSVPRLLDEFDEQARAITRRLRATVPHGALDWCDVEYRVLPGVPHITIAATAAAQAADLIVIGRPPRHWLGRLGSTVTGVLARSTCPVLTIPGPAGLRPDIDMRRGDARDAEGFRSMLAREASRLPAADPEAAAHPGGG